MHRLHRGNVHIEWIMVLYGFTYPITVMTVLIDIHIHLGDYYLQKDESTKR